MSDLHVLALDPERGPTPTAAVVAIHGLGATAEDLVGLGDTLDLPGVRWVFPQGWMPVAHAYGQGWAWYELPPHDEAGILESRRRLHDLLDRLAAEGIAPERTVVTGFSQGGVVTLDAGLRYPTRLAGLAPLSGYLFAPERLAAELAPAQRETPVFLGHGLHDDVIPVAGSRLAARDLAAAGLPVTLKEYPMAHQIVEPELQDLRTFLSQVLSR